jgi:hypothetical protein
VLINGRSSDRRHRDQVRAHGQSHGGVRQTDGGRALDEVAGMMHRAMSVLRRTPAKPSGATVVPETLATGGPQPGPPSGVAPRRLLLLRLPAAASWLARNMIHGLHSLRRDATGPHQRPAGRGAARHPRSRLTVPRCTASARRSATGPGISSRGSRAGTRSLSLRRMAHDALLNEVDSGTRTTCGSRAPVVALFGSGPGAPRRHQRRPPAQADATAPSRSAAGWKGVGAGSARHR